MPDDRGAESGAMYRWQGAVDSQLQEHGRRLSEINGDAKQARESAEKILIQVAVLRTKIAVWASIGGLLGAGVMTALITLVSRLST